VFLNCEVGSRCGASKQHEKQLQSNKKTKAVHPGDHLKESVSKRRKRSTLPNAVEVEQAKSDPRAH
jgi:hypothetical protein